MENQTDIKIAKLIDDLANHGYATCDELLPSDLVSELLELAHIRYDQGHFKEAKVGKGLQQKKTKSIRGDEIFWLESFSEPPLLAFAEILSLIKQALREQLFLPIVRFESHLSSYQPGSFYRWHVDRHRLNPRRVVSCVIYLSDWQPANGGLLEIKQDDKISSIEPLKGRIVLFDSRILHQVCEVYHQRWSLTSWFRDDLETLI